MIKYFGYIEKRYYFCTRFGRVISQQGLVTRQKQKVQKNIFEKKVQKSFGSLEKRFTFAPALRKLLIDRD